MSNPHPRKPTYPYKCRSGHGNQTRELARNCIYCARVAGNISRKETIKNISSLLSAPWSALNFQSDPDASDS